MWEKISEKKICRKFTRMLVKILFLRFPPNDNTRIFPVTPDALPSSASCTDLS